MSRSVWINGKILPESEARVSVYDSALMFGDMVFEMLRTFNGRPFKLRDHLKRLEMSAKCVNIPLAYTLDELEAAHDHLLAVNREWLAPGEEFRTLINVSSGSLPIYRYIVPCGINVMMTAFPLKWVLQGTSRFYDYGVNGFVAKQRAMPAQLMDPKIKHRSRLYLKVAAREAETPRDWPILLDPDGFISEGTGSNIFLVKDSKVYTPEPRNCLRGISRQYVMDLRARMSRPVIEKNLEPYDLMNADECFFTNTPNSIMPVTTVNCVPVGSGQVGPVTKALTNAWIKAVGCDWIAQSQRWDNE